MRHADSGTSSQNRISNQIPRLLGLICKGAAIGAGAILPGVSAGVLCVVFGIYQPMMEFLAHPVRSFRKHFGLLFPLCIGYALGFLLLARLIEWLFGLSVAVTSAIFAGLVAGTLPDLCKDAEQKPGKTKEWAGFALGALLLYWLLTGLDGALSMAITPNMGWFFFCGVVWGFSMVIPGLSSSSILIFMGLYEPMTAGIAALNWSVLLPVGAGICLSVLSSVRGVDWLLHHHESLVKHVILGIITVSLLLILPVSFRSTGELLLSVLCCGLSFAAVLLMSRIGKSSHLEQEAKESQPKA